MYIVNQARRCFGYDINEDDVVVDEVDVDDGYGPSHDPYFNGYMDIDDIQRRLANSKWPQADKDEFIRYCEWSIAQLEKGGLPLQREIAVTDGDVSQRFVAMVNERRSNSIMSCTDKCSREMREDWAMVRRFLRGIDRNKGYRPEEGRDCWSTMVQTVAYILLPPMQYARVVNGSILFYGQMHGEYPPPHLLNITDDIGNSTSIGSRDPERDAMYANVATVQTYLTFFTMAPIFILHTPPQIRECLRGYAELNYNKLAALNCYKSAVDFMCGGGDQYSIDSLRYKFGMESYKKRSNKSSGYDASRMFFSALREIIGYPANVVLSGLSNITLATGQNYGTPGAVLLAAGLAAALQAVCDKAQGWCEKRSAEVKLEDIVDTINRLNGLQRDWVQAQNLPDFNARCGVNSAALSFQRRQRAIQEREFWFGITRTGKGAVAGFFALVSIVAGIHQLATGQKPHLFVLGSSLANITLSGSYFIVALVKMCLRNDERMLKKQLFRNAEFARLNHTRDERALKLLSGVTENFEDRQHLLQNGKLGQKISREFPYQGNEYALLDLITDYALDHLQRTGDPANLDSQLLKWVDESWGVLDSMTASVLKSTGDKAPQFQREQLKHGLASLLNIALPLGTDRAEKRVRPSLVVLSRMQYFKARKADQNKSFDQIISDFGNGELPAWFAKNKERLLRGLRSGEEFIASVMHVYERSKPPAELDEHWIKFAKLVAIAQYMHLMRTKALQAVLDADLEKFPVQTSEGFDKFKMVLEEYARASIFDREEQLRCLKILAKNEFMQSLLSVYEDDNTGGADNDLQTGIKYLAARVDANQPLPAFLPSSPRSEYIPERHGATTTRIPQEVRVIQSSDSTTASDDNDLDNRDSATGSPVARRQEQNSSAKKSGKGSGFSPATSTSTRATSTSKKSSVRTDEDQLGDGEIVVDDIFVSSTETSVSESNRGEVHLWPRPWIEEV